MTNLSRACTRRLFWLAVLVVLTIPAIAAAENSHILIVAVQIAGENASDDLIKLYNPTDEDIFLGNYNGSYLRLVKRTKISSKDYSVKSWSKDTTAKIPAKGYFLWASSKNKSFPEKISADSQTSQILSENNGAALRIGPENTGEVIDSVGWGDFNNALFEGNAFLQNPEPGQMLFRKQINGIYQDTNNNKNDFYLETKEISAPNNTNSSDELNEIKIIENEIKYYPDGVVFSEILPSPEGPDDKEEWIELFNKNNFEVDLSGWHIKDSAGGIKTYIFPKNSKINATGYLIIKRTDSKITLNNNGDGLELIKPDNAVSDKVIFEKSPGGLSFNLTDSGWQWSNALTPGSENIIQSPGPDKENPEKEKRVNFTAEKSLASVKRPLETKNKIPAFVFFAALSFAIISSAGILFLKRKIIKQA